VIWDILGIEPTRDIKEIKKAYAALAKKNNPEEHPEEFRRIHDAYKAATAFAKAPVITPAVVAHTGESEDACAPKHDEKFTGLPEKKPFVQEEKQEEFNFSYVEGVNEKPLRIVTHEDMVKAALLKMEIILKDPTFRNSAYIWENYFRENYIHSIVSDEEFRKKADELIGKTKFNASAAQALVLGFGGRSKTHFDHNTAFAYFDITGRRSRNYYILKKSDKINFILVILLSILIILYFVVTSWGGVIGGYNPTTSAKKPENFYTQMQIADNSPIKAVIEAADGKDISKVSFDEETLYALGVGNWQVTENSSDYMIIKIRSDRTCSVTRNNRTIEGAVEPITGDKGAAIMYKITAGDTMYFLFLMLQNNLEFTAYVNDITGNKYECARIADL